MHTWDDTPGVCAGRKISSGRQGGGSALTSSSIVTLGKSIKTSDPCPRRACVPEWNGGGSRSSTSPNWRRDEPTLSRGDTMSSIASKRARVIHPTCETLEHRWLLSTISWVNRGVTSGPDNDRFAEVFGANAATARSVVDAAVSSWQRAIVNFNYGG